MDQIDVTDSIRSQIVTRSVSHVASIPSVRESITSSLLNLAKEPFIQGIVMEGRDIGTFVFLWSFFV